MNFVILGAILLQMLASRFNRVVGSAMGFLITAGILIWGLSVYSNGGSISFFTFDLSLGAFIIACIIWFGLDVYDLTQAIKARNAAEFTNMQPPQPPIQ